VDSASTALYLGTEADLRVNFRPLSDLGLSLTGGMFFPGAALSDKALRLLGRATVSISF